MSYPPLVTFGTPEYEWLLKPFSLLLEKYWSGVQVLYFSHARAGDMPANVEFRKLNFDAWNWAVDFGTGFIQALASMTDPIILISLMDMWPIRPLNLDRFRRLHDYLETRDNILRCRIGDDAGLKGRGRLLETWRGLDIYTADRSDIHVNLEGGVLLCPSLWKRELALGFLENCCFWDFEMFMSPKVTDGVHGVWVRDSVLVYAHTLFRENPRRIHLTHAQFSPEDKALVKSVLPADVEIVE